MHVEIKEQQSKITNATDEPNAHISNQVPSFCHIRVEKSNPEQTVQLHFTDFRSGRHESMGKSCGDADNRVIVTDEAASPYPVERVLCSNKLFGKNETSLSFINNQLNIYVLNNPLIWFRGLFATDPTTSFNLTATFHNCGGVIEVDEDSVGEGENGADELSSNSDSSMSGQIQSPNFGISNYTDSVIFSSSFFPLNKKYHLRPSAYGLSEPLREWWSNWSMLEILIGQLCEVGNRK